MTNQTPTRRPKFVTQRDGSALANSNCRMASIAMGLDYHTGGEEQTTAAKMRAQQDDQSGGTDSSDAKQAWDRGWNEVLDVEDGKDFASALTALRQGRVVHLDVWHAALDDGCVSGSGAYGHTIAVIPDFNGEWSIGDPWCTDGYKRCPESKLKAGAEEWGRRVYGAARAEPDWATSGPDMRREIVRRIVKRLMDRSYPGHERGILNYPPDTSGPQPILFTITKSRPLQGVSTDMAISTRGLTLTSQHGVTLPAGTVVREAPSSSAEAIGEFGGAVDFFGYSGDFKAVRVSGPEGSVIGYTSTGASVWEKEPAPPADIEKRDAEWREWLLDGSPGS